MNRAKLHHYVPQFHLRKFTDPSGTIWAWDRDRDKVFRTKPRNVAAESNFYYLDDFADDEYAALEMERQFCDVENSFADIAERWLMNLAIMQLGKKLIISSADREAAALYIALQVLRTDDTKDLLCLLAREHAEMIFALSSDTAEVERRRLHTSTLWNKQVYLPLRNRMEKSIWIFGRNASDSPFIVSDNPVTFRSKDNSMWLKAGCYVPGAYAAFPLSPTIIMYLYPDEEPWKRLRKFDLALSPVPLTSEMVEDENSGQVFMASRLIFSSRSSFARERTFAATIGTDKYARKESAANGTE